jgi:hypothetical protein
MSEQKSCVRCGRGIDAWAKICPFCNHDQATPVPATEPTVQPVASYRPPEDFDIRRKLLIGGAAILLLIAAFGVGALINSDDAPKSAPVPVAERPTDDDIVRSGKRADTQLVPLNEPAAAQPITSAPAAALDANIPNEYQRHDATAVSSVEYQQLAARAQAEKKATKQAMIDPMSLSGRAYAQQGAPPRRRTLVPSTTPAAAPQVPQQPLATGDTPQPAPMPAPSPSREVTRTHAVAVSQPLPSVRVSQAQTLRLDLNVGPDGGVHNITMHGVVPGQTAEILRAVQRWRFKPATENGTPISENVTVELVFKGHE